MDCQRTSQSYERPRRYGAACRAVVHALALLSARVHTTIIVNAIRACAIHLRLSIVHHNASGHCHVKGGHTRGWNANVMVARLHNRWREAEVFTPCT